MQDAIICDLDGTLALFNGRGPFEWDKVSSDLPNPPVAELLRRYCADYTILLVSGRSEECREQTIDWLHQHNVPWSALYMRQAGDFRKDAVVKRELWDAHIEPRYAVAFCLDDRDQSVEFWRSLGLPCWQVAPGNF